MPAPADKILFVDDEPDIRSLFQKQLSKHGYEVELAAEPSEALRMASTTRYAAIATDLRMPEMDGIELISRLQSSCPGVAVVLISGDVQLEIPENAWLDRTLVSVIPKPWDLKELLAAVSRAQQITRRVRVSPHGPLHEEGSLHVLLIEPHSADRERFEDSLSRSELHAGVTVADTLASAAAVLEREAFDVVVVDLDLPDAHGVEALRRIRELAPHLPLVALSGPEDLPIARDSARLGAQDFLSKSELGPAVVQRALRYAVERKRSETELFDMANRDYLTRLGNRSFFRSRLKHALSRYRRTQRPFAVIFLDLDRFKEINDGWGHHAGDTVLSEVASRLETVLGEEATLARLGGDEFSVLLEDVEDRGQIDEVADRILSALSEPYLVAGEAVETRPSLGIAMCPEHGETEEKLLRLADKAMYQAKRRGGAQTHVYEGADVPRARFMVERELRQALERDEFILYYQPQLDLATGHFCAAEALIRWIRPNGEMVPPGEFISSLEETGQIRDVGAWVLDQSCRQLALWRDEGLANLRVSFNVSPCQFDDGRLPFLAEDALRRYRLDPHCLEIEITEAVVIKDTAGSVAQLERLRALGIAIALDDFGTGYSSLSYLHKVPVDVLKMDRSFIGEIESSEHSRTLVELIIALGHKLKLEVVAEGVETQAQLEFLRREGCDRTQGYFHSRPVPPAELLSFLGTVPAA